MKQHTIITLESSGSTSEIADLIRKHATQKSIHCEWVAGLDRTAILERSHALQKQAGGRETILIASK